jgi:hypothetical protein
MNKKAQVITLVVFVLLFLGTITIVSIYIFGIGTYETADFIQSTQAEGLSQAGLNWAMEQFENLADWTTADTSVTQRLNPGTFTVTSSNATATSVNISVTSKIQKPNGDIVKRNMSAILWKLPQAFRFALYKAGGDNLRIQNRTRITGNVYSRAGKIEFTSGGSLMGGKVYFNQGRVIPTSIPNEIVDDPVPVAGTPHFSGSYYEKLMDEFDSYQTGPLDIVQTRDLDLTSIGILRCRTFRTDGDITIKGTGIISASGFIWLGRYGNCRIRPVGGPIYIITKGNRHFVRGLGWQEGQLRIGDTEGCIVEGTGDTLDHNVIFYNSKQNIFIRNDKTYVKLALIMLRANNRTIFIYKKAVVTDSTLYAGPSSAGIYIFGANASNYPICGNAIICEGRFLYLYNYARVNGMIYFNSSSGSSLCYIERAIINGSVVNGRGYLNNRIRFSTITYDPTQIPNPPPRGFNDVVMLKPYSWDGN